MNATGHDVILFPGQGSQEQNMGRDAAEANLEAMELWKKAEKLSGADLRGVYWDGGGDDMARTRYLQPALTVVNITLWMAAREKLSPLCAAGHSLGEFAALAAARAIRPEEALETTALRGRLMEEADPEGRGSMAAVLKLDTDTVLDIVAQAREASGAILIPANFNTPVQLVISGEQAALEAAAGLVKEHKGRYVPLPVRGAFHSPLMEEAAKELAGRLRKLDWRKPTFPVLSNVTGKPEQDPDALCGVMVRQMTSSVLWTSIVREAWAMGGRRFVELGPKGVLTRMLQPNLKGFVNGENCETVSVSTLDAVETL